MEYYTTIRKYNSKAKVRAWAGMAWNGMDRSAAFKRI